jgi:hypothetical protein
MNCIICCTSVSNKILNYNDLAWNKSNIFSALKLYHCEKCGMGFTYPDLPMEDLYKYYSIIYRAKNSPFYFDFETKVQNKISKSYPYANQRSFSQILLARFFTVFNKDDIFIDIGPGKGGSYSFAKLLLPSPKLYGIELTEGAKYFFKINFQAETYNSLNEYNNNIKGKVKIMLMSHSLEHYQISDLDTLFEEIKITLDDTGVIVIEVPHCDLRIHADIRGNDTPHTLFFSKQSLKLLLEKNGFEVLFIDTCGELWKTKEQYEAFMNSTSSFVKNSIRPLYNNLPIKLQNAIRTFVRVFYKIKNSNLFNKGYYSSLPQHTYGGNRNCLRVVAKKTTIK